MINPLGSFNSAFYPKVNRDSPERSTLHPETTSGMVASAAENSHSTKQIHNAGAAIGFPALGNGDIGSVALLDALARVAAQGVGVSASQNAVAPKAGVFGMYSALGQLTPSPPEPGSLIDVAV